ncbi:MAG: propanediol utilization microcompartment protein PduB [Chloroflexota bacterium]|nr:propanediol utilization microcompartment protein PduB [Anaerolineales bacterium]MCB8968251.1 propanediol utilization microcompartment protein PduB [Ardenticatenaceae bacterium]
MDDKLLDMIVAQVMDKVGGSASAAPAQAAAAYANPGMTEFVGTAVGETIGIVIANVDPVVHEQMGLDAKYRSIGILSARTGAGPQIMAADEAVKATNTEVVTVELARDTHDGAGHGSLIIFGAEEVSDARRAIEVALKDLERTFGDVYANAAGHIELQYTARASFACEKAFGAPIGRAFGLCVGAPAGIGVMMVDAAVKSADVDVIGYASPAKGTSFSNEVIGFFSGDAGAVRQAIMTAREVGVKLLGTLGEPPAPVGVPYI